jgi:hypothetical protein
MVVPLIGFQGSVTAPALRPISIRTEVRTHAMNDSIHGRRGNLVVDLLPPAILDQEPSIP